MKAIIFDIDGTLANIDHRLHFLADGEKKDWDSFSEAMSEDGVYENVVAAYKEVIAAGYYVILMTGRCEKDRRITKEWLQDHDIWSHELLIMRPDFDYRPDYEFKKDMLGEIQKEFADIVVFDDRQSVLDMWVESSVKRVYKCTEGVITKYK